MTRCLKIVWVLIGLCLANCGFSEPKTLQVASFEMDPYISSTGGTGYFRELVDAIFKKMGYELSYEFVPYLRAPKLVESGGYQVLAPAIRYGKDSGELIFSDPILTSDFGYVNLDGKIRDKNRMNLTRDFVADYLRSQLSTEMIVQQLDMLNAGRIEDFYAEKYVTAEVIANKRPALMQKFHFQTDPTQQLELRVAVNKSLPDAQKIIARFNEILKAMLKDRSLMSFLENRGYLNVPDEKGLLRVIGVSGSAMKLVKEMSPYFLAAHPGVRIQWTLHPELMVRDEIVRSLAFRTNSFDVITLQGFDPMIYAARGWTASFDNLDKSWDFDDLFASPTFSCTYQKKIVALPLSYEIGATFYRQDLFDRNHIKISKKPSFAELETIAKRLHRPNQGLYGLCMLGKTSSGDNLSLFYSMGVSNNGAWVDAKTRPTFTSEPWLETLATYKHLLKAYGPPDAETYDAAGVRELFAEGKCAMLIGSSSAIPQFRDKTRSVVADKIALVDFPSMKTKVEGWYWLWNLAVPKNSKNLALAQEFAAWATSTDFIKLVAEKKGWKFVPQAVRASIVKNPNFRNADPLITQISDDMDLGHYPKKSDYKIDVDGMVDLFEIWPAIGKAVGRYSQAAFEDKITTDKAMSLIQNQTIRIMYQSGLYSQKKSETPR